MNEGDATRPACQQAVWLILLGAISGLGYAVLLWLSWQFTGEVPAAQRPTLWMLGLFGGQFICYWMALRLAVGLPPTRWLLGGIFAAACLFRGVLLPSIPMHEIDIYRYIWDGAVLREGISPYRYSPEQVAAAVANPGIERDTTLRQLVELQASSNSLATSLREIHYGRYRSPYPLVSQAVFALAAQLTPNSASRFARLVIMKSLLVLADLGTLLVVMCLLRDVGRHPGWSLAYGWCPLLMKEVANGGHLDSIAIFLTTIAIWWLVRTWQATSQTQSVGVVATSVALALAIGAKLYPVVLLPLFAAVWLRRHGWTMATVGLITTSLVAAVLLWPLLGPAAPISVPPTPLEQPATTANTLGQLNAPVVLPEPSTVAGANGVQAFIGHWEMNDLLFMIVLENLRPQANVPPQQKPWFVVTTDDWSRSVVGRWASLGRRLGGADLDKKDKAEPLTRTELKAASFSLARVLTGGVYALVACLLAWHAAGKHDPRAWCRAGLLTLAWFWFTCPTQNPWYWCWVLPLLPFAHYRTWHVIAAVTMLYYLRFWLTAHFPDPPVLGTVYNGAYFFYFVVAWLEFLPCLLALAIEWLCARKMASSQQANA